MLIAIDFDGTYAAHPEAFNAAARAFLLGGHNVITVTSRRKTLENEQHMQATGVTWPILFAFDKPKKLAAIEAGWNVDVWIDDQPHMIGNGTEKLECVGVFENELRHAHKFLNDNSTIGSWPFIRELVTRLETVLGVIQ